MTDVDIATSEGIPVQLPSGASWIVLSQQELTHLNQLSINYLRDNHLSNQSDLQDLDKILMYEVMIHRMTLWVATGKNYFGAVIDDAGLRRSIESYSGEVRQLKKSLGMDKVSRDRQRGDASIPVYLDNLRERAKAFGIMREQQLAVGIELSMQIIALATLWRNCSEDERREMKVTAEENMVWILDVFTPEFEAVDAYFREHEQKMWVREQ